jgi:hypothetical protein
MEEIKITENGENLNVLETYIKGRVPVENGENLNVLERI